MMMLMQETITETKTSTLSVGITEESEKERADRLQRQIDRRNEGWDVATGVVLGTGVFLFFCWIEHVMLRSAVSGGIHDAIEEGIYIERAPTVSAETLREMLNDGTTAAAA